jgi:hypothetical protein
MFWEYVIAMLVAEGFKSSSTRRSKTLWKGSNDFQNSSS